MPLFLKFGIGMLVIAAPVAAGATLWPLYRQMSWSNDVSALPLRSDSRVVGRTGNLRIVSLPGYPPRHVGVEAVVPERLPAWLPLTESFTRVCPGRPTSALLSYTQSGDGELELLERAPDLCVVELDGTFITDAGIGRMRNLKKLLRLSLAHTAITDAALESVARLKTLKALDLCGTRITSRGLKFISRLPELDTLDLSETAITGDRLSELRSLSRLETLSLDHLAIDDEDLEVFCDLPALQNLSLAGTRVTDAGLLKLTSLPALRTVSVAETRVTDAGIVRFENARQPGAIVRH
jgi:hypothetical protein